MKILARLGLAAWLCTGAGCGDTGQHPLTVPLFAIGTAPEPFEVQGWTVELTDARVGIGPIYFCAAHGSSADLCPSAVAELTDSVTIDALDPKRARIGTLDALSLELRSAAWDFAITWPSSSPDPVVLANAPEGHSAHFEGTATRDDQTLEFVADLDFRPLLQGTHAVQGAATHAVIGDGSECTVRVDAGAWWSQVDLDELADRGEPTVRIAPGDRAYEALTVAMTSSSPPTVVWSD